MIPWLKTGDPFPPVERALEEPNGLLAAGDDLSLPRLIQAYESGIFPWYSEGQPVLWWSPDPRMVLVPSELRIPRSLRKRLAKRDYEVRADTAFGDVILACAAPRAGQDGTWITAAMVAAYTAPARAPAMRTRSRPGSGASSLADSTASRSGRMFYGESMFTRVPNASKIAFAHLVRQLERWGCGMIDCQMKTAHLARFGAREIPRAEFMRKLAELGKLSASRMEVAARP